MAAESRKTPWWLTARSLKTARNSAFLYTAVFVLYGGLAIATGGGKGNPWTVILLVLWGVLTAWGWFTFWYLLRHSGSDDQPKDDGAGGGQV